MLHQRYNDDSLNSVHSMREHVGYYVVKQLRFQHLLHAVFVVYCECTIIVVFQLRKDEMYIPLGEGIRLSHLGENNLSSSAATGLGVCVSTAGRLIYLLQ